MSISDKRIRYLVASIIGVMIISLWFALFLGEKQDQQFLIVQNAYQNAIELIQQGKYEEAVPLLAEVNKKEPNSEIVKYNYGISLANTGEWQAAANAFQQSLDINPYLVEDAEFMLQFGEILVNSNKLKEAKIVLQHCLSLPVPENIPDYQMQVNNLLSSVKGKTK